MAVTSGGIGDRQTIHRHVCGNIHKNGDTLIYYTYDLGGAGRVSAQIHPVHTRFRYRGHMPSELSIARSSPLDLTVNPVTSPGEGTYVHCTVALVGTPTKVGVPVVPLSNVQNLAVFLDGINFVVIIIPVSSDASCLAPRPLFLAAV